ncbi:hypothetical protein CC86DRAFT_338152 [Ophiobolus disseminans]|uniref:Tachykinin family protein n=1 Tax=Ophiobolus disseminans TaxID=1469910 RepID=A0A6A7AIJ5_9PLEO|nr:hypothetical protein CC86DRAFT_338152 [Ophiobolus disseminans]
MTAPPAARPLFSSSFDPYLPLASTYISSTPTFPSDSSFVWPSMLPHQAPEARPLRKKSKSPPTTANEEPASDGGLIFITGGTPADFKSKKNMTTVRKKAMDSFLKGDKTMSKKPRSPADGSIQSSVSNKSKANIVYDDVSTVLSTAPTTVSGGGECVERTKTSSPTRSFRINRHERDSSSAEGSVIRSSKTRDFILPSAPIVLPCRTTVPLPYDEHIPPLFVSIGKSLDPFRTMFQASHPGVSVEELKFHCSRYFGTRSLGRYWIPTALSYPHTFLGTLCLATTYHDVMHELPLESIQTVALRQEVIHLVGRNMLNPETSVSDHNIMAVIQLIISEVIGREESGLTWHESGIETMVKQRGGLNQLGVHGRLASSISWVSLAIAVLREEQPRSMYLDYCTANSKKHYQPTATIPESPIYCPRSTFKTIQRSSRCTPKAQELLGDIRMMIDIFLHETRQTRRNSQTLLNLYKKIISTSEYPSAPELGKSQVLTEHDWKYEAIRIASIIQATAIIRRLPLSEALSHAANPRTQSVTTNSTIATTSNETISLFEHLTSPSISIHSASSTIAPSYFPPTGARSSNSSINASRPSFSSTMSAPRPSMSSTHSAASSHDYFPAPTTPILNSTTTFLRDLRTAIEASNMSECWSDMAGVLLWVCLVVGAASKNSENKVLKKYFSALTMRAGIMLCFEHPEAINSTVLKMCEVVDALNVSAAEDRDDDGKGKGKKRRV